MNVIKTEIEFLEWDTTNFGFKTGKIDLEKAHWDISEINNIITSISLEGKKQDYKLIYIFCDNKTFISKSCISDPYDLVLADTKVVYTKNVVNSTYPNSKEVTSYKDSHPCDQLIDLALTSGSFSRFKLDKHFTENIFINIYSKWIERSVNKEIADEVLIYQNKNDIIGMLTYKCSQEIATIGLIAVNSLYQGKQVGTKLLNKLESKLNKLGVKKINVATQYENKLACNFYEKYNFKINHLSNIYHLWL